RPDYEGLHLECDGTSPRQDHRGRAAGLVTVPETRPGIALGQTLPPHLEPHDLALGSESVLSPRKEPQAGARVALEGEDDVDRVLDGAGTGQVAGLGDVSHQDHGDAMLFGQARERVDAESNLAGPAGERIRGAASDGVNGVDGQDGGAVSDRDGDHLVEIAAGAEGERSSGQAEPAGPARDLPARLLTRRDEAGAPGGRQA